jgi:hypothetical protein
MYKFSNLKFVTWQTPNRWFALVLTAAILSACATGPGRVGNVIVERAQGRWEALLAGDFEKAYSYYSPGYRSGTSVFDFTFEIRSRRVIWTSAQYREHSCVENSCTVLFDVGYRVVQPVPGLDKWDGSDELEEKWVKTGGQWWYLPKKL